MIADDKDVTITNSKPPRKNKVRPFKIQKFQVIKGDNGSYDAWEDTDMVCTSTQEGLNRLKGISESEHGLYRIIQIGWEGTIRLETNPQVIFSESKTPEELIEEAKDKT